MVGGGWRAASGGRCSKTRMRSAEACARRCLRQSAHRPTGPYTYSLKRVWMKRSALPLVCGHVAGRPGNGAQRFGSRVLRTGFGRRPPAVRAGCPCPPAPPPSAPALGWPAGLGLGATAAEAIAWPGDAIPRIAQPRAVAASRPEARCSRLFTLQKQPAGARRTRCRTQCSVFAMIWCISCSSSFEGMITICLPPNSAE